MKAIEMTLKSFIEGVGSLLGVYSVLAPSRVDGVLDYCWIDDSSRIELSDELPYKSPKEALFPRVEPILRFSAEGIEETAHTKPILMLGLKPCDAASINMLDVIFSDRNNQYDDPYYKRRRNTLFTVGMECASKKRGCFCGELGIDRSFSGSCDAFISIDGDSIVVSIINPAIDPILKVFDGRYIDLPDSTSGNHADTDSVNNMEIRLNSADERDLFESVPWDVYSESCLGCGTCTYICPTCHCFEFRDIEHDGVVTRNRCWDSCMYPKFTLHASGHNPRPTQKERFRQRVLHKYLYLSKNCSITACTGCGRCIRSCPGGVNIYKTVKDIISRIGVQGGKGAAK